MVNNACNEIRRIINATLYSWQGLRAVWRHEPSFRTEVWVCLLMVPLGLYLGDGGTEKALLIASVILVPLVEILNSAIEAVVDRMGEARHELSGRAKDMGSAAVALAIALVALVWSLVLFVE